MNIIKIGLDVGHGLHTSGKQTPDGIKEWTLNDKVADKVTAILTKDYDVEIIRCDNNEGNTDESLSYRVNKYINAGCAAVVSIHHNAFTGTWNNATGVEIWIDKNATNEDVRLAECVNKYLSKYTGLTNRGIKRENWGVINQNKVPAILCEGGFMDSSKDYKIITSDAGQTAYAKAVAEGLVDFLNLKKKVAAKTPTYVGYLDTASSTTATGWAWNSIDDTALKVELKAYRNGQVVRTFSANANVYRADLKAAGKGNGSHGFNTNINFNGLGYGTFVIKAFANGVQLRNEKTVIIEAPKATVTPKPSVNVSTSNVSVSAGQKLTLKKVKLYSTNASTKDCGTVTGTYYIWSASVENGRVRITNSPSRVGVNGQVTGFINVSDIGVKASTSTTTVVVNNAPKEGERIKLKSGATYFDGGTIPTWLKLLPLYHRGVNKYHKDCIDFSWKKTGSISGTIKADMVTKA